MTTMIHTFDADGYYTGSAVSPKHPTTGLEALANPVTATKHPLPVFDKQTHRARWAGDGWVVETLPVAEEPVPQFPRFYGNDKLDQLFTGAEQISVAGRASADAEVALTFYRMINSNYMSYEDPETEVGLSLLESKGLLTEERKAQIVEQMQPQ